MKCLLIVILFFGFQSVVCGGEAVSDKMRKLEFMRNEQRVVVPYPLNYNPSHIQNAGTEASFLRGGIAAILDGVMWDFSEGTFDILKIGHIKNSKDGYLGGATISAFSEEYNSDNMLITSCMVDAGFPALMHHAYVFTGSAVVVLRVYQLPDYNHPKEKLGGVILAWCNAILAASGREKATRQREERCTLETINVGGTTINIPIPPAFKKKETSPASVDFPGVGKMSAYFEYYYAIGSGKDLAVTSIAVFSAEAFNSRAVSNEDFLDLKSASRVGMKFQKEQMGKLYKDAFGYTAIIDDMGEYAGGDDFQASYGFARMKHQGYSFNQYTATVMMKIKGKIIYSSYGITTELLHHALAGEIKQAALAWRDAILAANE